MSREWKPGDVALSVSPSGNRVIYLRLRGGLWNGIDQHGDAYTGRTPENLRPLVVIDPEDREALERLCERLNEMSFSAWACGATDCLQIALREFADPKPPKPEEPTGDGAVVEDHMGHRWVRVASQPPSPMSPPWRHRGHTARWWEQVQAVRILSDGVQP